MYCARIQIEAQNLLPADLPATVTDASFLEWIASASNDVDDAVGEKYPMRSTGRRFASWPETPYTIQQCAAWLAAAYGLTALGRVSRSKDAPSDSELYREWAGEKLALIRSGDTPVYDQGGHRLDTGQTAPLSISQPDTSIDGVSLDRF